MKQKIRLAGAFLSLTLIIQGCCSALPPQKTPPAGPVVEQLVKSSRSWDGALLPAYPQGQPEVRLLRIQIPAGVRLDMHEHPVINTGILTRGQLTVVSREGKTLELRAGDPIVEVVDTWHYGFNPGTTDAEILVFYAGVTNAPITEYEPSAKPHAK